MKLRLATASQLSWSWGLAWLSLAIKANIEKRKARGYGIVNNILAIVNEIPLSFRKIQAGLLLRQAMLINGILFNSEAWHNISSKDVMVLEKVDQALLRGLIGAHSKTPVEALFLETNSVPLRYILKCRRIMYLHNILKKEETELVRKIYQAQKDDPLPGDFCEIVRDDMKDIGLDIPDCQISLYTKQKFKALVKNKISEAAFKYLKDLQTNHSKMQAINYIKFKLQDYLSSPLFNNESRNLLFRLRTRTVIGIKSDFKGIYSDTTCPLGCGQSDTLQNILSCTVLKRYHTSTCISSDTKYEHIFSDDTKKQKSITELFRQLLEIRNEILSQPVAARTGPMHDGSSTTVLQ